jgi:hypothetical protein
MHLTFLQYDAPALISHAHQAELRKWVRTMKGSTWKGPFLLDSGAFTAWSLGATVDLDELCRSMDLVLSCGWDCRMINLDVIPGAKGRDPTPQEVQQAMRDSQNNFEVLNKRFPGRVLPVFHQGEPSEYLKELEQQADYVCLSPRNDVHEGLRVRWAHETCHPGHKYHGLATTGAEMLTTVGWTSVDSASHIQKAAFGTIVVTQGGRWRTVLITDASEHRKKFDAHINTLPAEDREWLHSYIVEQGWTFEELRDVSNNRIIWNMEQMILFTRTLRRRAQYTGSLF